MSGVAEAILRAQAPPGVMRNAARGALSLPPADMLKVLVHLASQPAWSAEASATLANFDESSLRQVLSSPEAPVTALRYFSDPAHARAELVGALAQNNAVPIATLARLAESCAANIAEVLLANVRVQSSPEVLSAMSHNPQLAAELLQKINEFLAGAPAEAAEASPYSSSSVETSEYELQHAAEIAAAEGIPFSLTDSQQQDLADIADDDGRLTMLQKIAAMKVGERIKLALLGTRDERFVLIRDTNKVVAMAVLESPKVGETEMETYAAMKNVQEDVLRTIARNRRFMKHYAVIRALANNPRTPIDVGIPLLPHLTPLDLQHLARNKNVSDSLRKLALKLFKTKSEGRSG
jgi:hypothetical protein